MTASRRPELQAWLASLAAMGLLALTGWTLVAGARTQTKWLDRKQLVTASLIDGLQRSRLHPTLQLAGLLDDHYPSDTVFVAPDLFDESLRIDKQNRQAIRKHHRYKRALGITTRKWPLLTAALFPRRIETRSYRYQLRRKQAKRLRQQASLDLRLGRRHFYVVPAPPGDRVARVAVFLGPQRGGLYLAPVGAQKALSRP